MTIKAVTIVGRGPSWADCPFATDELWGTLSCLAVPGLSDKHFTKLFAFDPEDSLKECGLEVLQLAHQKQIPVVSQREYADEPFDMLAIGNQLKSSYWGPSLSYSIAYALYHNYNQIELYGIDQGPNWDYQFGKSYMLFWIGVAIGRGVDMYIGHRCLCWAYRSDDKGKPFVTLIDDKERLARHLGSI